MCLQIFSRYEKHRDLIIEEIFSSLAKLPTSKRNLRSFKCVGDSGEEWGIVGESGG